MKKFNSLLMLLLISFSSFTFTSCLEDEEEDCYAELQAASKKAADASMTFSRAMNATNCRAFKEAAIDFYNKAMECGDASLKQQAQQSKSMTESLNCSNY